MANFESPQKPTPTHVDERDHRRVIAQYAATCLHRSGSEPFVALRAAGHTPDALAADVNDWDLGAYSLVRVSASGASRNITGIEAAKRDGLFLFLVNVGANNVVVQNQNAGSIAVNRIITSTGADVTLATDQHIILWYDGTTQRWRALG